MESKNLLKKIFVILSIITMTSACNDPRMQGMFTKENVGAVTGAAGGAWLGSNVGKGKGNIAAIAAVTLLGGYLGKQVGASLDRADMNYYNKTSQAALENAKTGTSKRWVNPDSGNSGTITPTKTYQTVSGRYCREYTQTINVGGQNQTAHGSACREPDGTWQIVN